MLTNFIVIAMTSVFVIAMIVFARQRNKIAQSVIELRKSFRKLIARFLESVYIKLLNGSSRRIECSFEQEECERDGHRIAMRNCSQDDGEKRQPEELLLVVVKPKHDLCGPLFRIERNRCEGRKKCETLEWMSGRVDEMKTQQEDEQHPCIELASTRKCEHSLVEALQKRAILYVKKNDC